MRLTRRVVVCRATAGAVALLALLVGTRAAGQPPAPPPDADVVQTLRAYMADRAKDGFSGVVLVARGDTILFEQGYGFLDAARTRPVATDSVFTTGSITKQFTAAAILKLEMLGVLSTSDRLSRHLPGVPADKQAITLHQLLTHTAGLPDASGDDLDPIGRDALVTLVLSRPLAHRVGTYEYSNVGYSLLAAVVERVSRQPFERFVSEQLFEPVGMQHTGYSKPAWDPARLAHAVNDDGSDRGTFGELAMPNGVPGWHLLGNGGILSTARDMFRWHLALVGTAVLSEAAKAKLFRPWVDEGGGSHYGYGWSIEDTPFGRLVTHNGGNPYFFADFLRYLDSGVTVYYATNSRDRAMRRLGRPLAQIAHVGRVLDPPPRRFTVAMPDSAAAQLARRFVETLSADVSTRRARVAELFSAGLNQRRGAEALIGLFDRVRGDVGGDPPVAIEQAVDAAGAVEAIRLRYPRASGGALLVLVLDRTAPALRIDAIELEMGQ